MVTDQKKKAVRSKSSEHALNYTVLGVLNQYASSYEADLI